MGNKYSIFISKSLNKEEQAKEQSLLKKRRELLNEGTACTDSRYEKAFYTWKTGQLTFATD